MFGWADSIEIECDAPPYWIVKACESLGLESPLDVPWRQLSRFQRQKRRERTSLQGWVKGLIYGTPHGEDGKCTCGTHLPRLETYIFTLLRAGEVEYQIGQCSRCHTLYWDGGEE